MHNNCYKLKYFIETIKWLFAEKCALCKGQLRGDNEDYFGGIDIKENLSGNKKHTAYVCNMCYQLFGKRYE